MTPPIGSARAGLVSQVGDAIPDGGDLQAHYDWTKASGTSAVVDQTGNSFDLTGTYTGPTASINGTQAGEFDGNDDFLDTAFNSTIQQPFHYFVVYEIISTQSRFVDFVTGDDTTNRAGISHDNNDETGMFAGSVIKYTDPNPADPHIVSGLFDGTNSVLRVDGTQEASGNPGSDNIDGLAVGARPDNDFNINTKMGEILVYPQDKTAIQADVERYLSNKWGITI